MISYPLQSDAFPEHGKRHFYLKIYEHGNTQFREWRGYHYENKSINCEQY